jgi:hypothetical protein
MAEAKKLFDAGLKLMKEQLYQEALVSFLEAYKLAPRESLQNNIALCYRNLKDLASAYTSYEELLARFGDKMKPASKADAQRALEELSLLTGTIAIKVMEPDAKVLIDGREIGKTPIPKPVRVNIGPHPIAIAKAGFETLTTEVTIKGRDEASVDGPLEKEVLTGHVAITVIPADPTARVIIDGKEIALAPWQGDLEPGTHAIEARGLTTIAAPKQVDVQRKAKIDVALDLKPQEGFVSVNGGTADAEIAIDGKPVGRGAWEGSLPAGQHEVLVTKPGSIPYKKVVLVHTGERLTENVVLMPEGGGGGPGDYKGVYVQLNLVGLLHPGKPGNDIAQGNGLPTDAEATNSLGYGGGINLRAGYSFGFIGIEGAVFGTYDYSSSDLKYAEGKANDVHPAAPDTSHPDEAYGFHRFGAVTAIAVRAMPKMQLVRPTVALGAGAAFRGAFYTRQAGPNNYYPTNIATYVAPCFVMDGGVEIGHTPGVRFYLGILLLAEISPTVQASPSNPPTTGVPPVKDLAVTDGAELFLGPILGIQFGQ